MRLYAYIASITVMSPVIFTSRIAGSSETGFLYTTSPYIHNYPLIYGLMDRPSEAAFVVSAKTVRGQQLQYKTIRGIVEGLASGRGLPGGAVYSLPATPIRVGYVTFHTTMLGDQYYFDVRGRPKTYAPRNQNYIALAPGSRLQTVVVSGRPLRERMYASIGVRRLGILRFDLCPARVEPYRGAGTSSLLVNEGDTRLFGYEGRFMLAFESRTSPSWNPAGSRISWYTGGGMSIVRPASRDAPGCRRVWGLYRRGDGGGLRWLVPLPRGYEYS